MTTTLAPERAAVQRQRAGALTLANRARSDRAILRRRLSNGTTTIAAILADPPACIGDLMLCELLLWAGQMGRERLRYLNAAAIRDGVNLMVRADRVSERTADWVELRLVPSAQGRRWAS